VQNTPAEIDQTILFRQTERSGAALVAYPFNRSQRIEFQGGITQISFDQIVQTTTFSLIDGGVLSDDTKTTSLANPLTLATTTAAFVSDTSNYGATSPVQGQRYRVEASPAFGSINFTSVLADYRRYFMPAPFYTFAARVMHYGRYGNASSAAACSLATSSSASRCCGRLACRRKCTVRCRLKWRSSRMAASRGTT